MEYVHKAFIIEPLESSKGKWRATIHRMDGEPVRSAVTEREYYVFTTGGTEAFSPEAAVDVAKTFIDSGGLH